jgi:hypothetical protein
VGHRRAAVGRAPPAGEDKQEGLEERIQQDEDTSQIEGRRARLDDQQNAQEIHAQCKPSSRFEPIRKSRQRPPDYSLDN